MSNITTYTAITTVADSNLLVVSDTGLENNPTRSMSVGQLKSFINSDTQGVVTSLVVNRSSGNSTLIDGVLNIPNYNSYGSSTASLTLGVDAGGTLYWGTYNNTTGATFTATKTSTGKYRFTASSDVFEINTVQAFVTIMNPNVISNGVGTSEVPQITTARVLADNVLGVEVYNASQLPDVLGALADIPSGGYKVTLKVEIFFNPQ